MVKAKKKTHVVGTYHKKKPYQYVINFSMKYYLYYKNVTFSLKALKLLQLTLPFPTFLLYFYVNRVLFKHVN